MASRIIPAMESSRFARALDQSYRKLYRLAVRRVDDGRNTLSPETTAPLVYLAQTDLITACQL